MTTFRGARCVSIYRAIQITAVHAIVGVAPAPFVRQDSAAVSSVGKLFATTHLGGHGVSTFPTIRITAAHAAIGVPAPLAAVKAVADAILNGKRSVKTILGIRGV